MSAPATTASQQNHMEHEHEQDDEHRGSHLNQHYNRALLVFPPNTSQERNLAPHGSTLREESKIMMTSIARVTCKNKVDSTARATLTNTAYTQHLEERERDHDDECRESP